MTLNLSACFEETWSLLSRPRRDRPSLNAKGLHIVEFEDLEDVASTGSNSAHEPGRITGIPERRILHRVQNIYPYNMQVRHQILPADTAERQNFATFTQTAMERDIQQAA